MQNITDTTALHTRVSIVHLTFSLQKINGIVEAILPSGSLLVALHSSPISLSSYDKSPMNQHDTGSSKQAPHARVYTANTTFCEVTGYADKPPSLNKCSMQNNFSRCRLSDFCLKRNDANMNEGGSRGTASVMQWKTD